MKVTFFTIIPLVCISTVSSHKVTTDIPFVSTDNYHGDYIPEEALNETDNIIYGEDPHHLHSKSAESSELSEENHSINNTGLYYTGAYWGEIDRNSSDEDETEYSLLKNDINNPIYNVTNGDLDDNSYNLMQKSGTGVLRDTNISNSSGNHTAGIAVTEDKGYLIRGSQKGMLGGLLILLALL